MPHTRKFNYLRFVEDMNDTRDKKMKWLLLLTISLYNIYIYILGGVSWILYIRYSIIYIIFGEVTH